MKSSNLKEFLLFSWDIFVIFQHCASLQKRTKNGTHLICSSKGLFKVWKAVEKGPHMKISFEMTLHLVHFFCFYPEVKVKSGGVVGKVTVGHPVITDSFRHIKSADFFQEWTLWRETLICSSREHIWNSSLKIILTKREETSLLKSRKE